MKIKERLPISLNDQIAHRLRTTNNVPCGSLNPNFVEALMGFPQDWTKL